MNVASAAGAAMKANAATAADFHTFAFSNMSAPH
jgi:hypothetical protein